MLTPFESFLTIVLILSVLILPILIYFRLAAKKQQRRLKQKLEKSASQNQLNLTSQDAFGSLIIASDTDRNVLLILNSRDKGSEPLMIDLAQVKRCSLNKQAENNYVTEISLLIELEQGKKETILFYRKFRDNAQDMQQISERADYWKQRIAASL